MSSRQEGGGGVAFCTCMYLNISIITPGCVRGFVRPSVRACVRAYV